MTWLWISIVIILGLGFFFVVRYIRTHADQTIKLPAIRMNSSTSVEEALSQRRSVRLYKNEPIEMTDVAQLLWAAQGVTDTQRLLRSTPSAGALYPLEVYLVAGSVKGLTPGVFKYQPKDHELTKIGDGDKRVELSEAAYTQQWIHQSAASIVICAVYKRTEKKYGSRARQYVHMEVGAAVENVYLQATALGVGTVLVGAFDDEAVKKIVGIGQDEEPVGIMPLGKV
jgi:SagB-type dehydrogenase family enzyme